MSTSSPIPEPTHPTAPTWLTVRQAADYVQARCTATIYREVKAGRLKAARIGGRRELRFRTAWLDEWLEASTTPVEQG